MPEHTGTNECVEAREATTLVVDHLGEAAHEHRDAPVGTILALRRTGGGAIRRTDRERSWRRVTVETVSVHGGGAYQDTTTAYEVTFEGGTPSATHGWELAHATFPPLSRSPHESFSSPPFEERQIEHARRVKSKAQVVLEWEDDVTEGQKRRMGATYLREWAFVRGDRWHSVYRAVVVKPNMA